MRAKYIVEAAPSAASHAVDRLKLIGAVTAKLSCCVPSLLAYIMRCLCPVPVSHARYKQLLHACDSCG